jgi:Trk K+ transport system NAD-binding subunit
MRNSAFIIVLHRLRAPFLVLLLSYSFAMAGLLVIDGIVIDGKPYQMSIFDAFYFVTYTATTIGFGETPYEFTYAQRIWTTVVIYIVVIGWFYSIGTIIGLIQDKQFLMELARGKFRRQIKGLKQKYIIVLGYNYITSEIVKKAILNQVRVVVIEKDHQKVNSLLMESFTPIVPVLTEDASNPKALTLAGIDSSYCQAIVTLFNDDTLNLKVAITAKLLNKNIFIATRSKNRSHTQHLKTIGVEVIKDPFEINAFHIKMAITSPNLLRLERWSQKLGKLTLPITTFPNGKYIVCGFGSLGRHISQMLHSIGIDATFIEINHNRTDKPQTKDLLQLVVGDGEDKEVLTKAGVKTASTIIIGTNNDTENLSILAIAKSLNPDIVAVVRENEVDDFSIFTYADIDYLFMPPRTLINQITNAIINPLTDKFDKYIYLHDEDWATALVKRLIVEINDDPMFFKAIIDYKNSPALFSALDNNKEIKLDILKTSLSDKEQQNRIIPLLVITKDEEILLPQGDYIIKKNDEILFALDENALDDIEYILENVYEFDYVTS